MGLGILFTKSIYTFEVPQSFSLPFMLFNIHMKPREKVVWSITNMQIKLFYLLFCQQLRNQQSPESMYGLTDGLHVDKQGEARQDKDPVDQ